MSYPDQYCRLLRQLSVQCTTPEINKTGLHEFKLLKSDVAFPVNMNSL